MPAVLIEIALILILLGVCAFFSIADISFVFARKARLRALVDDGNNAARRVLVLAETPSGFLATVRIGAVLTGLFGIAIAVFSFLDDVSSWLREFGVDFISNNSRGIALVLIAVFVSFLFVVLGELVPKTLAIGNPESVALRVSRPVEIATRLARPVIGFLVASANAALGLLGSSRKSKLYSTTTSEIAAMVELAESEGVVESSEAELVEEALEFGRILVRSVMVPRVDVRAIDGETTFGEAVDVFFSTGFSRLPVYKETPDDVLGILYVKDTFQTLWKDKDAVSKPVIEALRPAYFVPESKPIDELLQELKIQRTHVAIIVDEYGGMAGLATLEDLIEELVGDITDEFDPSQELFKEIEPGVLEVDGRISLNDLLDRLDIDRETLEPFEAESIGGLIADRVGRIPQTGDSVESGPLRIEVQAMDGYRVALARVERRDQRAAEVETVNPPEEIQ